MTLRRHPNSAASESTQSVRACTPSSGGSDYFFRRPGLFSFVASAAGCNALARACPDHAVVRQIDPRAPIHDERCGWCRVRRRAEDEPSCFDHPV